MTLQKKNCSKSK